MMGNAQSAYADKIATNTFLSNTEAIYGSENDFPLVKKSAELQMGNLSYKIHYNLKKNIMLLIFLFFLKLIKFFFKCLKVFEDDLLNALKSCLRKK